METTDIRNVSSEDILNGRFLELWVDGEERANVVAVTATSTLNTTKVPVAGTFSNIVFTTSAEGSGEFTIYKLIDDDLDNKINDAIKEGKPFEFDLTGQITNNSNKKTYRVLIEQCVITSFKPIDASVDGTDPLKNVYSFEYEPSNVTING